MGKQKISAVVVPLYKEQPNEYDNISLTQCFNVLSDFPIIALKPKSLDLEHYLYPFSDVYSFDDDYFKDIASYNSLMMSSILYQSFLEYEYILIYQTDAFVFKNELKKWCEKKYDYIGAPWLRNKVYPDWIKSSKEYFRGSIHRLLNIKQGGLPSLPQFENRVGNGGFSLRKTSQFYSLCKVCDNAIATYLSRNEKHFNEDVFWSVEVNRYKRRLKIPSYKKAVFFAFESHPEVAMELTEGELPLGCHAWDENLDFFRPIFHRYGYDI